MDLMTVFTTHPSVILPTVIDAQISGRRIRVRCMVGSMTECTIF